MTDDPIFNAFAACEMVWPEIDRLVTTVPELFSPHLSVTLEREEGLDDWASSRHGYHFKVSNAVPKQRLPGQILLLFDLSRPATANPGWPHARRALLTCAYVPKYKHDTGWSSTDIAVTMDGALVCQETQDGCRSHAGRRLLEWVDTDTSWNRRGWLFSVPLLNIDDRQAFAREVVAPVVALIKGGKEPQEALAGTSAIQFNV